MKRAPTILVLTVALALGLAACGDDEPTGPSAPTSPEPEAGISDADLSILRGSVFDTPTPPEITSVEAFPGGNDRLPPLFPGAPPRIPHGIVDFLPIDLEDNGCVECHFAADPADAEDAPQVTPSHLTDLRNAPDVVGTTIAGARWVCTACHLPLTTAKPLPMSAPGE